MRRFIVWSALIALIGLILAVGGYWAYQHFYARFQPVTITRNQADIQKLLDEASWVSAGGGGEPLYIIGYRDSAAMQRYEREEAPKLRAAGVEPRFILFARADREGLRQSTGAERATVAELWLTRDWTLYRRWTATPSNNWTAAGLPAADGNLARGAVVEAGRDFIARLSEDLREEGLQPDYPIIVWRDREGFMKTCGCSDPRSWAFIRDDLDAPDRVESPEGPADPAAPMADPGEAAPQTLPYPTLPAPTPGQAAPIPGQTLPPASGAAPRARPAPTLPPGPRAAPEPKRQEDSTFY